MAPSDNGAGNALHGAGNVLIELLEDYNPSLPDVCADGWGEIDNYSYPNAATCPDCQAGMVRLGSCFSCPVCGFGGCA